MARTESGNTPEDRDFRELFAAGYWPVRDYLARRAPEEVIEDLLAETFVIAWRRVSDIRRDDPVPWLIGVARRVLANELRAQRRRHALTDRLCGGLSAAQPEWEPPEEMSPELAAALERLPAVEREVLLLVAWDGLEPRRAAEALGCTLTAFRVRLHRARRRIAGLIAEPNPAPEPRHVAEEACSP